MDSSNDARSKRGIPLPPNQDQAKKRAKHNPDSGLRADGDNDEKVDDHHCTSARLPTGFLLNRTPALPAQYNKDSISLAEIITGDIKRCLICNYIVDFEWLIDTCPNITVIDKVDIVHGERDAERKQIIKTQVGQFPNMTVHLPRLPISYGTHHTKMMILYYDHGVRVVICTLNLLEGDWLHKTQGIWMQDFPLKTPKSPETSEFEMDLLSYLSNLKGVNIDHSQLKNYDMSMATGFLVASVPGYHRGPDMWLWGHMRVRKLLYKYDLPQKFKRSPVIHQFSSMGSITEDWLINELGKSFQRSKNSSLDWLSDSGISIPPVLLWPTVEAVRNSVTGYSSGGSLPMPKKNCKPFLQKYLHVWDGSPSGRRRVMPHIKSYMRVADDELAWFILTSSNCSKAAWGAVQKKGTQLMIRSYELGILLIPGAFPINKDLTFSCTSHSGDSVKSSAMKPTCSETHAAPKFRISTSQNPNPNTSSGSSSSSSSSPSSDTKAPSSSKRQENLPELHNSQHVDFPVPMEVSAPKQYTRADSPWIWDKKYTEPDITGECWDP